MGLALASVAISYETGELRNPFKKRPSAEIPLANRFQFMLFVVTMAVFVASYASITRCRLIQHYRPAEMR